MYHNNVRTRIFENSCKIANKYLLNINFKRVETSYQHIDQIDMAESSLNLTMTERSQNLLKIEADKCNNSLPTQKKMITDKMLRCKEMIK